MRNILKAAWHTPGLKGRMGLPVIFRGAPGVGKSEQIEQTAAECGLPCETILASVRDPADFLGLPIPVRGEAERDQVVAWMRESSPSAEPKVKGKTVTFTRVTYAPPAWAVRLAEAGNAVGFMDEISSAPPAVQAALLRVILEGVVGDCHLPPGIRWVAAANPTETAAGGWDIAPPLANRFGHMQWTKPTSAEWSAYMLSPGRAAEPDAGLAKRARDTWGDHYPKALGTVSAFLNARPDLLLAQPGVADPKASEAWPSPRSWSMAVHAWAGANVHGLRQEEREVMVAAFVGAPAMAELCTYAEKLDLPDPAQYLDGLVKWEHSAKRIDQTYAVLAACAAFLTALTPKGHNAAARCEAMWRTLQAVSRDTVDFCLEPLRAMHAAKFPASSAAAAEVYKRVYPALDAANRMGCKS